MKTKVLICGATGFIGRNLTEQLSKRPDLEIHAVRYQHSAYDSGNNVIWHQADFRKQDDVDRVVKGMHIIIQAAASIASAKDVLAKPYAHVTDNTIMNSYLFRAAFEHKVQRVIYLSSADIYPINGSGIKETDFDANTALQPETIGYTQTKLHIEKLCEFYANASHIKFSSIRLAPIYGPHDKFDLERAHLLAGLVTKAMTSNTSFTLKGTGEEQNEFVYVDDVVQLIEAVMEKQTANYRIYNCGHSESISTSELSKLIIQQLNKEINIENDLSLQPTKTNRILDCTLAQSELGWHAKTDLNTGLRKTISWWKENVRIKQAEPA